MYVWMCVHIHVWQALLYQMNEQKRCRHHKYQYWPYPPCLIHNNVLISVSFTYSFFNERQATIGTCFQSSSRLMKLTQCQRPVACELASVNSNTHHSFLFFFPPRNLIPNYLVHLLCESSTMWWLMTAELTRTLAGFFLFSFFHWR